MAQSYTNIGGSGARSQQVEAVLSGISFGGNGISDLLNGTFGNIFWFRSTPVAGSYFQFDFMEPRVIDEAKWYQNATTAQGTWKWQGSNDGLSFTNVGSSFTLGGALVQTITTLNGNTTAYRYWRLTFVSGATSSGPYIQEIEFRIDQPTGETPSWCLAQSQGNRSASITVTSNIGWWVGNNGMAVNGILDGSWWWSSGGANYWIKFDFGTPRRIVEAKWCQSVGTGNNGTWKWQGSNDDATWIDIGNPFTLFATGSQHLTELNGNTETYRYYKLVQTAGTTTNAASIWEVFFKMYAGSGVTTIAVPIILLQYF